MTCSATYLLLACGKHDYYTEVYADVMKENDEKEKPCIDHRRNGTYYFEVSKLSTTHDFVWIKNPPLEQPFQGAQNNIPQEGLTYLPKNEAS